MNEKNRVFKPEIITNEAAANVLSSLTDAVCICDPQFRVVYCNELFSSRYGADCASRSLDQIVSFGKDFNLRRSFLTLKKGGGACGDILFNNGNEQTSISIHLSPVMNGDVLLYITAIFIDNTQNYRNQMALELSEQRYRSIVNNISEYIYSVEYGEDGIPVFSYHSPRCIEITGYSRDEFEKNPNLWHEMIHPSDKQKVTEHLDKIHREKKGSSIEHRIIHKSGLVKHVSNSSSVTIDDTGRIIRIDGFILDITDRTMMEEGLKKLYIAVEQSPVSIMITDLDGIVEYVNPKFEMITGYQWNEIMGQNSSILIGNFASDGTYESIQKTILSGKEWIGEVQSRKKNGELYWEHLSISPIIDKDNNIMNIISIKEDMTAIKQTQRELEEKERVIRQKNELIEQDLKYARKVQMTLLPQDAPELDFLTTAFRFQPLGIVGGDYLSFLRKGNGVGIFVADAVGHGISAALFMSLLKFATDSIMSANCQSTADFLLRLNSSLYSSINNYFITAVVAFLTPEEGGVNLEFSNGGHPPLIIYRKKVNKFEMVQARGTILGMFEQGKYGTGRVFLEKGDRLYFYTDGVPETSDEKGTLIGYENIVNIVADSYDPDVNVSIDRLFMSLDRYRGKMPFEDDILVVVTEVK